MNSVDALQAYITRFICTEMDLPPDEVDLYTSLGAYGVGSLAGTKLIGSLEQQFSVRLSPTLIFEYPTIAELAQAIAAISERSNIEEPADVQ